MIDDDLASDVIVVGSGPAGVSAAWALLDAGVRVLMLDAAEAPVVPPADDGSIGARRRASRRDTATSEGADRQDVSPKLATPLARSVLAGFEDSLALSARGFLPVGSLAAGGLSRIWGAFAYPYVDADLAGFPDPSGFASSFARVRARVGIGVPNDRGDATSAHMTAPVRHLLARHRAVRPCAGLSLSPASNAVLFAPKGERRACNGCGLCLHGCARGAIYDSALDLPALRRDPLFTYRPGHRVVALGGGPRDPWVETRHAGQLQRFQARRIVLAAGTIGTTTLVARRLGLQGRPIRLLSNPVGGAALVVPSLIGCALPERSFALGQLSYRIALDMEGQDAADLFGVLYGADALPLAPLADRMPFTRSTSLRLARALAPALILVSGYLPGRFSDNTMTVEGNAETGRVFIEGSRTPQADVLLRQGFTRFSRFARRRGAWMLPGSTTLLPPGADAHPVGTLPMGGSGPFATSPFGEIGCGGIHVVDGAALPTLAAVHPTLTIMANADRIGRRIAALCHQDSLKDVHAGV